jgi:hypothetical protein
MRFRLFLGIVMAVSLTAAACTSSSAEISTAPTTPDVPTQTVAAEVATETTTVSSTDPQTCEEVADVLIAINQEFLDELGDMSVEEFEALGAANRQGTLWPAFEKLGREGGILLTRAADELGCSDRDLQTEERLDELTPSGPAGELWVELLGS